MLTCTITRPGLKLGSLFLISSTCPGGWKDPGKQVSPFSWDRSELLGPRLSLRALLQPSLLYLKQYSLKTDNPFDPSAASFGLQKQKYDTTNFNTSWLILRELVKQELKKLQMILKNKPWTMIQIFRFCNDLSLSPKKYFWSKVPQINSKQVQ